MAASRPFSEVKRQRPPGQRWRDVPLVFLALFLIAAFFAADVTAGFVVLAIFVMLLRWQHRKRRRKETKSFECSCAEHGVAYKANYSDPHREFYLGLSEASGTVLAQFRISYNEIQLLRFDVPSVLNVELHVGEHAVYRGGPIAALSGAAVGGLAFGGAGAIVGSLTSARIGGGKIGSVTLQMRVDDLEQPIIAIDFLDKPAKSSSANTQARLALAEKWTNLIEVLRYRLSKASASASPAAAAL